MTFSSLLQDRCTVQRTMMDLSSGSAETRWVDVKTNVPCNIDLMLLRQGRDPVWSPQAGTAATRVGVAFFKANAPIKNGDRIVVTKGPRGIFTLEMAIDEVRKPGRRTHLEVFVNALPAQMEVPFDQRDP